MRLHPGRRSVLAIAAVLMSAVVAVSLLVFTRSSGPAAGSVAGVRSALHPVDVAAAESSLDRAARSGASSGRLLVLTNQLLDLTRNDSTSARRAASDAGLAAVSGYGCGVCEAALERARP